MYHLRSQQKRDGTLKLVKSNQVYLHRCRRMTRETAVPKVNSRKEEVVARVRLQRVM